ncbi:Ppx/GppA phosphatase [Xylariaceae sp. FL0255]|nr:Ppx/GppA phosphatase [Xylariaceae sp. FL0255]
MASSTQIITLDNFAAKLPTCNGIRFSISDLSPPCPRLLKTLYRERAAISLFDALNASSTFDSSAFPPMVIFQVSQTVARFKSIAVDFGVPLEHISVFATEAMRKASNAAFMLDAIASTSGLGVHVLAPEVEVLFGMNVLEHSDVEVRTAALDDLSAGMYTAFSKLKEVFPQLRRTQEPEGNGVDIYLCGGGFRGYGSILLHTDAINPYPIPTIGAYTVDGSVFKQTAAMRKVNAGYDGKIFGMSQRRRFQFPAIATVVEALIGSVPQIRTVTFCGGGNREGALLLKLPLNIREEDPLSLLHPSSGAALDSVVQILRSALPPEADFTSTPTIFTLGLGPLFVSEAWSRMGEPSEANAAYQLHQSVIRDPSVPGFTHLARSVLGLTLCSRWGGGLGPIDKHLFESLKALVSKAHPEANFWAEYIGALAHFLADICPLVLRDPAKLTRIVKSVCSLYDPQRTKFANIHQI